MKRWPLNKAYFWETAPFFRILLPFAAGIICYDKNWLPSFATALSMGIISLSFILYLTLLYINKGSNRLPSLIFGLLYLILFLGGYSISSCNDVRNDGAWFGNGINKANTYLARITEDPIEKEHSWKVPITLIRSVNSGKIETVSGNAFLYLYKDHAPMLLHKGDSILMPSKWQPIKNSGNPFEFDYTTYAGRNGLFYTQSCSANDIRLYATGDPTKTPFIERAHNWCMQQLDTYIKDPITKGLIQAMILGDEANLDEELRQSYAETGIIHIIAISGGNVAIFFIVISFLLLWLRHKKHLWVKYAIALPLVWFYILMAGAAPSAVRAAVMFSLLAFSIMFEKSNNSFNQLFVAAFLLLCVQPMWLFSVGFQLSFVAVLSLILFYTPIFKWVSPINKIARLLWGTIAASVAAEVLVAPLVICYFHTFPLLFIVANAVAYLFMGLVLILGIAIIALSFIPVLAAFIGVCTVWIVTLFDNIVTRLQQFNPGSFHFLVLNGIELLLVYLVITGITVFLFRKQKQALFIGLSAACLLLCSFCIDEWSVLHQERLVVYNIPKAAHIELIKGGKYAVLGTDTSVQKKISYIVKPAHTSWQAWRKDTLAQNELLSVNGKTILLLNNDMDHDGHFPVDILIINYIGSIDAQKLKRIFSPALIVTATQLGDIAPAGTPVHSVTAKGAFVLQ